MRAAPQGRSARATPVHLTRDAWQLAFAQLIHLEPFESIMQAIMQLSFAQLAMSAKHWAHPLESEGRFAVRHARFLELFAHVSLLQVLSWFVNS
jgi:hypothetical protein